MLNFQQLLLKASVSHDSSEIILKTIHFFVNRKVIRKPFILRIFAESNYLKSIYLVLKYSKQNQQAQLIQLNKK